MGYTNCKKFARWQAIAALDISTELLLFIFCIALIWGLQMHISHKMVIMISFAARLPYVPLPSSLFHFPNAHLNPYCMELIHL